MNYKKSIILGVLIVFIVVVLVIYGIQENQKEKYSGELRNFATDEMSEDFTNVYADVVSIQPKHYVYKYATNRTGIKLNDGDLTQIVCECETVERKTIWVSFFYWECPAYNSFGVHLRLLRNRPKHFCHKAKHSVFVDAVLRRT